MLHLSARRGKFYTSLPLISGPTNLFSYLILIGCIYDVQLLLLINVRDRLVHFKTTDAYSVYPEPVLSIYDLGTYRTLDM